MRSRITTIEHRIVVFLRALPVLVPPDTQRGHIVGGNRTDGAVGILREMAELHLRVFRHRLEFEREDAQFVHHPRHTVGHHTQVLGTYEHTGGLGEFGQFLHGLAVPELVVATVIVVVVEFVEDELITVVETLVDEVELNGNARMELVRILAVAQEEHVTDERVESVADGGERQCMLLLALVVLHFLVPRLHLALRVESLLHTVASVVDRLQEIRPHVVGILVEHAVDHPVHDERLQEQFVLEMQTIGLDFLARHSERRRELAEQTVHGIYGNLPDAEEA